MGLESAYGEDEQRVAADRFRESGRGHVLNSKLGHLVTASP